MAVEIVRTHDMALVREIFEQPRILLMSSDDAHTEVRPVDSEIVWYLTPLDHRGRVMGLWIFMQLSAVLFDSHVAMLPEFLGKSATDAGVAAMRWMFANSPAKRMVGSVPVFNSLAIRYAERIGMDRVGVHPQAFLKGGKLYDLVVFGKSPDRPQGGSPLTGGSPDGLQMEGGAKCLS